MLNESCDAEADATPNTGSMSFLGTRTLRLGLDPEDLLLPLIVALILTSTVLAGVSASTLQRMLRERMTPSRCWPFTRAGWTVRDPVITLTTL